jgi:hypothetical protein
VSEERPHPIKNPEQERKLTEWLEAKAQRLRGPDGLIHCPICNSADFEVGSTIAAIEVGGETGELNIPISMPMEGSASPGGPAGYAMIPVECDNCAYLMMFNASPIGLMPS